MTVCLYEQFQSQPKLSLVLFVVVFEEKKVATVHKYGMDMRIPL